MEALPNDPGPPTVPTGGLAKHPLLAAGATGWYLRAPLSQQGYRPKGSVEFLNWMVGNSGSCGWKAQKARRYEGK